MVGLLLVLFLVLPILELWVIIEVGTTIGVLPTLALLILVSVVGAWLVRQQGTGIWRRAQSQLAVGELPADELIDGLLVLFAGALMLTPGFVTDLVGLLLLVPVTRSLARAGLARRFKARLVTVGGPATGGRDVRFGSGEVIDVGDVTPPQWRRGPGPGAPPSGELGDG